MIDRRALLLSGAGIGAALLTGCGASGAATPPTTVADVEARTGRRLAVHALDTGTGATAGHRDGDRVLMCSTVKAPLAAFVLHRSVTDPGLLDRRIRYTRADLLEHAPVTSRNVGAGMTVAQLCEAAVTVSDNTAANLLSAATGGPGALTAWLRSLGDATTRADRTEPSLNSPDGERDTSTPAAFAATLRTLVLGDALPAPHRDRLAGWLRANTTGEGQIRGGVPAGWSVGDKTGGGNAGEKNDVGVLFPPHGAPMVLTVFSAPADPAAPADGDRAKQAIADATRAALAQLGRG
ncbi:class A beta-lactamase [Pseudonocardia phyllosphaerae]|uniref:class A beta-lactamase n=1 Tax=Pseudonocardia phyllosphaerae TaxID=3390502 RepID=UPI00397BE201